MEELMETYDSAVLEQLLEGLLYYAKWITGIVATFGAIIISMGLFIWQQRNKRTDEQFEEVDERLERMSGQFGTMAGRLATATPSS